MNKLPLALLIPDTHRPYHDRKAYGLMMNVAADLKPAEIVILGDYADFYCVSSHAKHSGVKLKMLIDEVEDVKAGLDEIDKSFKFAKKVYIEGNHEYRFERYLNEKAPELFGLSSTEHLLDIPRRPNWKFIHYGPTQKYMIMGSKLMARHEPPGSSAKAAAAKALCSITYGHIHRIEEAHIVGLDEKNHVAFSVGWLGEKRYDKIFGYVKDHFQWQLGFGLVYVDEKTGYFYHQKIHILDNYTCVVNGKLYKA